MNAMARSIGSGLAGAVLGLLALGAALAGCGHAAPAVLGGSASSDTGAPGSKAAAPSAADAPPEVRKPVDPATAGSIRGVVRMTGAAPAPALLVPSSEAWCMEHSGGTLPDDALLVQDGAVANAVVFVSRGLEGYRFPPNDEPVELDQQGCRYTPRVLAAQVNQTVNVHNSDPLLHNVNARAERNAQRNYAMPEGSTPRSFSFRKPEIAVPLACDVHPWMRGAIVVLEHPCFAITGADGTFTITGVPPGTYSLDAWHEVLGRISVEVEVAPSAQAQAPELVFRGS